MTTLPPLSIRAAIAAEALMIAEMHTRSRASAYRGLYPDHYLDAVMPEESRADWLSKMQALAEGAGIVFVAQALPADGGAPTALGFTCVRAPDAEASALVDNLHVMPGHKGCGVGKALLAAAAAWARAQGARRLHLLVLDTNTPAIGFYEAQGWRRVGARPDDSMGGIPVTVLVYALALA